MTEFLPKGLVLAFLLLALALMLGVALGIPAALWLSQKITNFLTFTPTEKLRKPLPLMGQASTLAMQGDLEAATEKYEEFLFDFPEMKEIYLYLVELVIGPMKDEKYGDDILARASENLPYSSDLALLLSHADSIRKKELIPPKHLEWCDIPKSDHSDVRVPELIKGRMLTVPRPA